MVERAGVHRETVMSNEPVGDICVLADAGHTTWTVGICMGGGARKWIGTFPDLERACAAALAERDRARSSGVELTVHFPDDCPCYRRGNLSSGEVLE